MVRPSDAGVAAWLRAERGLRVRGASRDLVVRRAQDRLRTPARPRRGARARRLAAGPAMPRRAARARRPTAELTMRPPGGRSQPGRRPGARRSRSPRHRQARSSPPCPPARTHRSRRGSSPPRSRLLPGPGSTRWTAQPARWRATSPDASWAARGTACSTSASGAGAGASSDVSAARVLDKGLRAGESTSAESIGLDARREHRLGARRRASAWDVGRSIGLGRASSARRSLTRGGSVDHPCGSRGGGEIRDDVGRGADGATRRGRPGAAVRPDRAGHHEQEADRQGTQPRSDAGRHPAAGRGGAGSARRPSLAAARHPLGTVGSPSAVASAAPRPPPARSRAGLRRGRRRPGTNGRAAPLPGAARPSRTSPPASCATSSAS